MIVVGQELHHELKVLQDAAHWQRCTMGFGELLLCVAPLLEWPGPVLENHSFGDRHIPQLGSLCALGQLDGSLLNLQDQVLQQVGAESCGLLRHVLPFFGLRRQQRESSLRADLGKDNEGVLSAIHLDGPIVL